MGTKLVYKLQYLIDWMRRGVKEECNLVARAQGRCMETAADWPLRVNRSLFASTQMKGSDVLYMCRVCSPFFDVFCFMSPHIIALTVFDFEKILVHRSH